MESARCKAFVTAAETGSFSKAGEVLGYTPSGVSQLVTSLERELGLPLLGRNRKGVTLTENGPPPAAGGAGVSPAGEPDLSAGRGDERPAGGQRHHRHLFQRGHPLAAPGHPPVSGPVPSHPN